MRLLTQEESLRAWDRLKRGGYSPIVLGAMSGAIETGGSAVHLAKGMNGVGQSMRDAGMDDLAYVAERAVSLVRSRVLMERREVKQFLDRHLKRIKETD
jgi:hypothetical protein